MEVTVVIPTAGRAKVITSHKHVSNCIVCCPESELEEYQKTVKDVEIVTHPDSVKGLQRKRQWIYDKWRNVFMMDDDLKGMLRLTAKKGESVKVDPESAYWYIQNAANLAKIIGCHLFGFNVYVVPEHYVGEAPFRLKGFINACGWGFLEGGYENLKFNPMLKTNEDFYISALNAHFYRMVFIDARFCFAQDSFGNTLGGCANIRNSETEKEDLRLLKAYFGNAIMIKPPTGIYSPRHETAKRLKLPF